jgi:hypothetical protein
VVLIKCREIVQNGTAKIINSIGSKSLWMEGFYDLLKTGFLGRSPMHWLVLEEFG